MSGSPTECRDNPHVGRTGCGATYSGNRVHCTLPADWSTHPDGLCHETFGGYTTWDHHANVSGDGVEHVHPAEVSKADGTLTLTQDERGVWHVADARRPFDPSVVR